MKKQEWIHQIYFCYVYFVSGFINAFDALSPLFLTTFDVSYSVVGLAVAVSYAPNVLKVPCCIMSDRYSFFGLGYRKPYITLGMLVCGFAFLGIGLIKNMSENFLLYVCLLFTAKSGYVMFDGVLDGLMTETLNPKVVGRTQGVINALRGLGIIVGAVMFGFFSQDFGWYSVFFTIAAFIFSCILGLFAVKELSKHEKRPFVWAAFKKLTQKSVIFLLLFAVIGVSIPGGVVIVTFPIFLSEFHFGSDSQIGIMLGVTALGLFGGAAVAGVFLDKFRKRFRWILFVSGLNLAVGLLGFIIVPEDNFKAMYIFVLSTGISFGVSLVATRTCVMLMADTAISSSFFGILETIFAFCGVIGQAFSGTLLTSIGAQGTFGVCLVFVVAAFFFIPFIKIKPAGLPTDNSNKIDSNVGANASAIVPAVTFGAGASTICANGLNISAHALGGMPARVDTSVSFVETGVASIGEGWGVETAGDFVQV